MKKILILGITAFAFIFVLPAKADRIKLGKRADANVKKGSVEYFSKPFNGIFDAEVTNPIYNDKGPKWRFYDDGKAIMFHNAINPTYECYFYTVRDGIVSLEGVCAIRDAVGLRMLPEKPADLDLKIVGYGPGAVLEGSETAKGGRKFRLSLSPSDYISRYTSHDFTPIMKCRYEGITRCHENLWLVTSKNGASACASPDEGMAVASFDYMDIIQGRMGDEGDYVLLDYIDSTLLYVNASQVKKIGDERMLQEVLYNDAGAGIAFTEWQNSFAARKHMADTSGYTSGVKAGRLAAEAFIPMLIIALILLALNLFNPPFFPNFLFHATYVFLILLTLYEGWYIASLKQDVLWFIFDPVDPLHGFAGGVSFVVFIILQVGLIVSMERNFGNIYSAYTTTPLWLEVVLAIIVLFIAVPLSFTGTAGVLLAYLLLFAACLPAFIGYMIHSADRKIILPFLILCYPVKYVFLPVLLLWYVFAKSSKVKLTVETDDDGNTIARDINGNMVNLTRNANGDVLDNDGNSYTGSGNSYTPNGADRNDGPYFK